MTTIQTVEAMLTRGSKNQGAIPQKTTAYFHPDYWRPTSREGNQKRQLPIYFGGVAKYNGVPTRATQYVVNAQPGMADPVSTMKNTRSNSAGFNNVL